MLLDHRTNNRCLLTTIASGCIPETPPPPPPRGVPHPRAGEIIDPYIMRCECGGRIGICETAQGAAKWRSHMRTKKHYDWQGI